MEMLGTLRLYRRGRSELRKLGDRVFLKWSNDAAPNRLPDFLIIGAMKSGTTALHRSLAQHPDIFMTHVKEPLYFLDDPPLIKIDPDIGSKKDLHKLMFRGFKNQHRVGESSTRYTAAPSFGTEAPGNIHSLAPDMRFIYILRNPLARIVSHYMHCVEHGIYSESMSEALKKDATFLERSLYHSQLVRYLECFDRDRFLITFFEDFTSDPGALLRKVCRFLEVPEEKVSMINPRQRNVTLVSSEIRDNNSLFDKEDYDSLIGPIREDVRALEEFMGRNIDHWDLSEERWCNGS